MIFLPVAPADAQALRAGRDLPPGPAYASTHALREHFGFGADEDEDADFAAQIFASLRCLIDGRDRCVLAAEVDTYPAVTGDVDFGEVARPGVRWRDVRAIFVDDPASRDAVRAYAESLRGQGLAAVWSDAGAALTEKHDLLWFDPTELDEILRGYSVKGD